MYILEYLIIYNVCVDVRDMAVARNNLWTLITSALIGIIGSTLATFIFPFLEEYLLIFVVMVIVLTGIALLLDSMMSKINDEQIKLEKKIEGVEEGVAEKVRRVEELIDVKAESKYLKDRMLKIEEMMKDGS